MQAGALEDNEEDDIAAVNGEANDGVVRVMVDSGAARSVPKRKLDKKPKLAAANGTRIEAHGEAIFEF